MTQPPAPTALLAEDEPLLAAALQAELRLAWPELHVLGVVGDGAAAVTQALALQPDVLFLDIRMPGMSGLEAATELLECWPNPTAKALPALVFVTAYDQYAVQAFDTQAVDYLLKPVQPARLAKTVAKLKLNLASLVPAATSFDATLDQLRQLLSQTAPATTHPTPPPEPLRVIQASVGTTLHMVPVNEVVCLQAADKYVRVLTAEREYLIRTPLKELLPQLDTHAFWQIHRGTVVNAGAIDTVTRDEFGKLTLSLRNHPEKLPVSRLYAGLFKAM